MDRYVDAETAAKTQMPGVPGLVKLAWDIALIFPELGDEIIADLCGDIRTIVDRETQRMAAEADVTAKASAREFWGERMRRAYRHGAQLVASLAAAPVNEGIDPTGFRVYLLWPEKGAHVPVYVGRSANLLARLGQHMSNWERRYATQWITVIDCPTEQAMIDTEERLIAHYQPHLNTLGVN